MFAETSQKEIQTARDGQEAFEYYEENKDDIELIVTDLNMPIMDGFELIKKIRSTNSETPIIVCSANIQEKTLTKVKELGANDLIAKPDSIP